METVYALLWLEGPMQAWGYDSYFGVRQSLDFPTKSGVLGMLLAGMGKGGSQEELLAELSPLSHTCFSLSRSHSVQRMVDYHVVGNGFRSEGWESMMIPRKRDGGYAVGGGSKLTFRHYLQDAVFAVIMEIPSFISDAVESAFEYPVWPIFLGRKCCVPSKPIFRGIYPEYDAAEIALRALSEQEKCRLVFRAYEGNEPESGDVLVLHDVPICFGTHKRYSSRYVTIEDLRDGIESADN